MHAHDEGGLATALVQDEAQLHLVPKGAAVLTVVEQLCRHVGALRDALVQLRHLQRTELSYDPRIEKSLLCNRNTHLRFVSAGAVQKAAVPSNDGVHVVSGECGESWRGVDDGVGVARGAHHVEGALLHIQ